MAFRPVFIRVRPRPRRRVYGILSGAAPLSLTGTIGTQSQQQLGPYSLNLTLTATDTVLSFAKASATGKVPLQGSNEIQTQARSSLAGKVPLQGKADVSTFGRLTTPVLNLAMTAKAAAQSYLKSALAGKVPLQGTITSSTYLKVNGFFGQVIFLLARAATATTARLSTPTLQGALTGRIQSQVEARVQPSGSVPLQAKAEAMTFAKAAAQGKVLLSGLANTQVKALSAATFKLALAAKATATTQARIAFTGAVKLSGTVTSQVYARAAVTFGTVVALVGIINAGVKARLGFTGKVPLQAKASVQTEIAPNMLGAVKLSARNAIAAAKTLPASKFFAQLSSIPTIMVKARLSNPTQKLSLQAASRVMAKLQGQFTNARRRVWAYIIGF